MIRHVFSGGQNTGDLNISQIHLRRYLVLLSTVDMNLSIDHFVIIGVMSVYGCSWFLSGWTSSALDITVRGHLLCG